MRGNEAPIVARQLLQSIYATTPEATRTCMLYPEAMLFPRIFHSCFDDAPLGAVPLFMLMNPFGRGKNPGGLASILNHIPLRIRSPNLLTSMDQNYRSFLFTLKMNALLNFYPVTMLVRKGPEDMKMHRSGIQTTYNRHADLICEDSFETRRTVRELAYMGQQVGLWNFFVTITCNDNATPGVAPFIKILHDLYPGNADFELAYSSYLPIILRLWDR